MTEHAQYLPRSDSDHALAPLGADSVAVPDHSGTTIARMRQPGALSTERLDSKRLLRLDHAVHSSTDRFRELRTRILFESGLRNPVILVTGVGPCCGTSFVARNLAMAIAMDEERTALLIDCNLSRPTQGGVFDATHGAGLADYLRTPGMTADAIIHATAVSRLRLIPAGNHAPDSRDRLASLRMRALIAELHSRYPDRCLVLDAPPATGSPEARMLAQRANMVLLVAGQGQHTAAAVQTAARVFDPARLAGVVFNELH